MRADAALRVATSSAAATRSLGRRLGAGLRGGDLVCLIGELGAGKTTFTQGLAAGMGFRGQASSPTFVLERDYRGRAWTMHHLDFYRVGADGLGDVGLEDCLADPKGICVIEWPAAASAYLPAQRLEARLVYGGLENERTIFFKGFGTRPAALLRRLASPSR